MEELSQLKALLLSGDINGAIAIVDDLEEMSLDDKINNMRSFAIVLLVHLIKQQAEQRTTRSWEVSIRNASTEIRQRNKRRKAGGSYLTPDELREMLEEAYFTALNSASLEVEEGRYEPEQLAQRVNQAEILDQAIARLSPESDLSP